MHLGKLDAEVMAAKDIKRDQLVALPLGVASVGVVGGASLSNGTHCFSYPPRITYPGNEGEFLALLGLRCGCPTHQ